jgi:hypothetical protein
MRRSLSHRYQQGQSLIQLGAISFFDDRSQVECRSGAPLLAGFARSEDFFRLQCSVISCAVVDLATSLLTITE